jgi:[protein-PII] uridylyltransferase
MNQPMIVKDKRTDAPDLAGELAAIAFAHAPMSLALRQALSAHLKDHWQKVKARAETKLLADGRGTRCAQMLSRAMDEVIRCLHSLLLPAQDAETGFGLVAVGGYGRGTLAPGSDIDLLFLLPAKSDPQADAAIEFMLYALWDMRLKVGHSTRNIEDCIRLSRSDTTILTSILEARYICGNQALAQRLQETFSRDIVQKSAKSFVADKLAERDVRLKKSGESRYLVEPDIKDGKGGLRDLQTIFWIAKFVYHANDPDELAEKGAFTRQQLSIFQRCENFLWAVRCHLHFVAGRAEDRLSFERQSELAARLGYQSHAGLKNVERFMKHYFLTAKEVGDLTRIFCASLEARQVKDPPMLARMLARITGSGSAALNHPDFKIESGRIALSTPGVLAKDPVNLLRLFSLANLHKTEIHPDALMAVRDALKSIDAEFRRNPEANALFLDMLANSTWAAPLLRMMNEAGVLGRFIPEFGRVVALMQFNMYHHYTVDEHLIRTVGVIADIESGRIAEDHPLAAQIIPTLKSRRALLVAAFLHDIAKGRTEDHSLAGERIARSLGPRLGLSREETETVAWLVRHHLLMSETAQTRDLNDFKTILDFAQIVQSPERLKLLLILTVADIRAVGPGVWNGWKGQLLRTLYYETEPVLTGGHTGSTRAARVKAAQEAFFSAQPRLDDAQRAAVIARHYDAYWLNTTLEKQTAHQALLNRLKPRELLTEATTDAFTAITALTVVAPDHPRLLALITGACAAAGCNIMGAQIYTTTDGLALDTILIQREFDTDEDELRRAERTAGVIRQVLQGKVRLKEAVAAARRPSARLKAFTVEPRVIIDNQSSNKFTVIEVNGLDRIGLLHDLTDALFGLNLNIASAHITTYGEKAVDVFYVTDLTGAKIESASRQAQIERKLNAVLAQAQH